MEHSPLWGMFSFEGEGLGWGKKAMVVAIKHSVKPLVGTAMMAFALAIAGCAAATGNTTLSASVNDETGAFEVVADGAEASNMVSFSITVGEGDCLVVMGNLSHGLLHVSLYGGDQCFLNDTLFLDVQSCYDVAPGDYTVQVSGDEAEATGSVSIRAWNERELAGDKAHASLLDMKIDANSTVDMATVTGGWELNTDPALSWCTEEQISTFVDAASRSGISELGWSFRPVAMLATQTDESGNAAKYVYLCQSTIDAETNWTVLTIELANEEAGGGPMLYVQDMSTVELAVSDAWQGVPEDMGWQLARVEGDRASEMPRGAQVAFERVVDDLVGKSEPASTIVPLCCIASQPVAGVNYLYLVETQPADGSGPTLSFLKVYHDLDGAYRVTSNDYMDLMAYVIW